MSATLSAFLSAVDTIQAEQPTYRLGGKAEDGTCDCIGLIIGALTTDDMEAIREALNVS